jgi:hypothetical protein
MENGPPRMSVDQMLWMGIGSNPGKMLVRYFLPSGSRVG